ncbi:MAG: TIGR03663 family protein, partial [Chloroflexota bacterium]|nr:TIGR03663 family protein [Chloroflexota bacterium]
MSGQASSSTTALEPAASPLARLASLRLRLDWEVALYLAFILAGGALRFWDLGARALHHDESLHAQYAYYLYNGGGYEHMPMMHGPFQFFARAFSFLLFGVSDYTARIPDAFLGTALIGVPFLLRHRLGRVGALAAAGLIAFSPTMLYYSRFARNDMFIALWTLGLAVCLWRYIDEGRHRWLYLAAGLVALSFATKEVTYLNVAVFLIFLNLWVAHSLAAQIRERHKLDRLTSVYLFVLLAPFAWAVVAFWPFLSERLRQRLGITEMPRAAHFLLILGTLSLPQFAAAIQKPLEWFGIVDKAGWSRELFTVNLGPFSGNEHVTREELTGFLTVTALIAATAVIGLRWNWRAWLIAAGAFYLIYGLLYTTFLTNADGFGSGIWGSLDYWLEQQDVKRGGQPFYYYLLLLPIYEFLPLLFALPAVAYFAIRGNAFTRFLAFWLVAALYGYSIAGEKMPWLNVHLALPTIILAGYTLGQLWNLLQAREWHFRIPGFVCPLLAAAVAAAAVAFAAFGPTDAAGNTARILVGAAALLAIVALALTLRGRAIAVVPVAAVVGALLLFSVRAAWMASFAAGDGADAREMLVYTQSSPDIPQIRDEIERWASQTGLGNDLPIAVDGTDAFTWPWAWYLRNYPNVQYPTMDSGFKPPANAVVLVNASNDAAVQSSLSGYGPGRRYHHRWWFPEIYRNIELKDGKQKALMTTFADFLKSMGDGDTWQVWWRYWRDRQLPEPLGMMDSVAYFPSEFTPTLATRQEPLPQPKPDKEGRFTLGESGASPSRFVKPAGLAVDRDGNLYVADSGNNRIQKFDREGKFIAQVGKPGSGEGEFNEPWGVAVDSQGNVYVADTWNHRIQKFDRDLKFLTQWGRPASDLNNPKPFDFWGPRDVAIDPDGNVWVTDTGDNRLLKFAPDGTFQTALGKPGAEPGQFQEPVAIEIAANGDIFVADAWNSRVQRFDRDLKPLGQFPVPGWVPNDPAAKPYLALAPDGSIIASEPAGQRVLRLGPDGSILSVLEG